MVQCYIMSTWLDSSTSTHLLVRTWTTDWNTRNPNKSMVKFYATFSWSGLFQWPPFHPTAGKPGDSSDPPDSSSWYAAKGSHGGWSHGKGGKSAKKLMEFGGIILCQWIIVCPVSMYIYIYTFQIPCFIHFRDFEWFWCFWSHQGPWSIKERGRSDGIFTFGVDGKDPNPCATWS